MIKLTEFLLACKVPLNLHSYKIHLATDDTSSPTADAISPLEAFFEDRFKEWQENQRKMNFRLEMVIGLIKLKQHSWLFAGVYKILGYEKISDTKIAYSTQLLPNQNDLIGRIVVHHQRQGRGAYLIGKKDGGDFYISQLTEERPSVADFPGYNAVNISHRVLKIVIGQSIQSWCGALSNIKGVYLISDVATGQHYVGSAIGNDGIWQRWADYALTGHGGNKELKALLSQKPNDYRENFHYAILEIADSHASDDYILKRESHWKDILLSRKFGYNNN